MKADHTRQSGNGHGGRRTGAGRPFGSKDSSYKKLGAQTKETMRQAEELLRNSGTCTFKGDSVALLISIYQNKKLPLPVRMNAAMAAAPYERPKLNDQRVLILEQAEAQKAEDERRYQELAEQRRMIEGGDKRIEKLVERSKELADAAEIEFAERRTELQQLLKSRKISRQTFNQLSVWLGEDVLLALPKPPEPGTPQEPHRSPPVRDLPTPPLKVVKVAEPELLPPAPSAAAGKAVLILFAAPHAHFALPHRSYDADGNGEVRVKSERDAKILLRSGCLPSRDAAPLPPLQRPGYE